jgi:hypothetical protein
MPSCPGMLAPGDATSCSRCLGPRFRGDDDESGDDDEGGGDGKIRGNDGQARLRPVVRFTAVLALRDGADLRFSGTASGFVRPAPP